MPALQPIFLKAYWTLAIAGILWATFILSLINPTIQRHALYAHKIWPPFGMGGNVTNPEEFGFASTSISFVFLGPSFAHPNQIISSLWYADEFSEGQVQPFWLNTTDNERLFCWHVLPLDVYLDNEAELVQKVTSGEVVDGLEGTVGKRLMKKEGERVVVNFHGVSRVAFSLFSSCILSFFSSPLSLKHVFYEIPSSAPYLPVYLSALPKPAFPFFSSSPTF
jgi:hypothetical protein